MAGSENLIILAGNLGQDPEIRNLPSGQHVARLRLATSDSWEDKQGNRQEKTYWHTIVLFAGNAKIAQQYLKKGSKVYIRGSLRYNEWEDNQGVKRKDAEIIAQYIMMLDAPKLAHPTEQNLRSVPQRSQISGTPPRNVAAKQLQAAPSFESEGSGWDFDDEIPFK